ncbi:YkvA family protein [Roseivirga sp.]|uniref:YkvA family protein n=1 Tax=Roseivirga sp. TaxID=1964215 RepID=UPI003B8C5E2A
MSKEPSSREKKIFNKFKGKAESIVSDNDALRKLLVKLKAKLDESKDNDSLRTKLVDYLKLLSRMIGNTINGTYKDLPWQTMVMMVGGLLYFIAPLDALPDFIPIAGLVDDATILIWLGKCFSEDLDNYKSWENSNLSA